VAYDDYATLKVECDGGVARVTIDHPPINLFDMAMIQDFLRLGMELEADDSVRVAVFASADPEFFIAHADVELIQGLPTGDMPRPDELTMFHAMVDRFRTMPKVTIAQIEGRTRGGGSELVSSMDMRFGAIGRAVLAQPEVALGIIPGGSGTQRLPRLMGRARALEAVLGCADFDAVTAERYGWLNRALPPDELGPFVDDLARRIAGFPAHAIARAKAAVAAAEPDPVPGLITEGVLFQETLAEPETRSLMQRFLAAGGQTREVELELARLVARLQSE
jgi:enoyl-CoA hydratase/carnithine racemase